MEGCFCPQGTTLFNSVYNMCVTSCGKIRSYRKLHLTRSWNTFHNGISWHTYNLPTFVSVWNSDCVGPDGKPKQVRTVPGTYTTFMYTSKAWAVCLSWFLSLNQFGDTWTSDCNTCVCDKDSMCIQCQRIQCPLSQIPSCSEPCQQLVNKTDGCCTTYSCGQFQCHRTRCAVDGSKICKLQK